LLRRAALIAVLALVPAASAFGASSPSKDIQFAGVTSQDKPFAMKLAVTGRKVELQVAFDVSCTSGLSFPDTETVTAPAHPKKTGRRLTRVKFTAQGDKTITLRTPDGKQAQGKLDLIVAGNVVVSSGRAKGRVEPTVTLDNGDKCTSGLTPITWTAAVGPASTGSAG
jgi:hypothetical protein